MPEPTAGIMHFEPFYYFTFERRHRDLDRIWKKVLLNFARCIKKKLQTLFLADPLRPHTFVSDASNAATTNTSGTPFSVRRTLEPVPRSQATRHPPPSNYLLVNHHTSPVPRILPHNAVMSCFVLCFHWVTKTELRL